MSDYDELVKQLRCLKYGSCPDCPMWYSEEVEPNLWRERCAAIDAADAIEELSAIRDKQKAQIILMAAEIEEQQPRWIPVSERMPGSGVPVLICGDGNVVEQGVFDDEHGYWYDCRGYRTFVHHWMPLPEPPKRKGE